MKIKVARPVPNPKIDNSFFEKLFSTALAVKMLVKKTMVIGLDIVNMKAEVKLEIKLFGAVVNLSPLKLIMIDFNIKKPKSIKTK